MAARKRKPLNQKVKDFLVPKYSDKLTSEAKNCTRGDLLKLAKNVYVPHILKITVGDLKTLNEVLFKYAEGEEVGLAMAEDGGTTACCCCAPCCCCCGVATLEPLSNT